MSGRTRGRGYREDSWRSVDSPSRPMWGSPGERKRLPGRRLASPRAGSTRRSPSEIAGCRRLLSREGGSMHEAAHLRLRTGPMDQRIATDQLTAAEVPAHGQALGEFRALLRWLRALRGGVGSAAQPHPQPMGGDRRPTGRHRRSPRVPVPRVPPRALRRPRRQLTVWDRDGNLIHEPDPTTETPERLEHERYKRGLADRIRELLDGRR